MNWAMTAGNDEVQPAQTFRLGSPLVRNNLCGIFGRLDAQLASFEKPISDLYGPSTSMTVPIVPIAFKCILDANTSIDALMAASLGFVQSIGDSHYTSALTVAVLTQQLELQTQFVQWLCCFETLLKTTKSFPTNQREPLVLQLQYYAYYIWLSTCLVPDQTVYDSFHEEFEAIITTMHSLGKISNSVLHFVLDKALIPPLFLTAIKCRRSSVRCKTIEQLYNFCGREGLWDSRFCAKVAERVVAIEKSALDTSNSILAEQFRIHGAEMSSDMDTDHPTHYVTFYMKPDGLDRDWLIWKEDVNLVASPLKLLNETFKENFVCKVAARSERMWKLVDLFLKV